MPTEPITLCNKPTTNENFDYAFESFFVVIISNCDKEINNSYPRLCKWSQKSVIVIFLSLNFGGLFLQFFSVWFILTPCIQSEHEEYQNTQISYDSRPDTVRPNKPLKLLTFTIDPVVL